MATMADIDKKMGSVDPSGDLPTYLKALQDNAGDSNAQAYLKWKATQIQSTVNAIQLPIASTIISTMQKTNFTDTESIAVLCSLLWERSVPDIPIISTEKIKLSLRPSVDVLSPPPSTKLDGKEIPIDDKKPQDFDPAFKKLPTFNSWLIALTPSLPISSKTFPAPPAIALQLGNLMSTEVPFPKAQDWIDTQFVVLLNPGDMSLWIAFNYNPYNRVDGTRPITIPTKLDPANPPGGSIVGLADSTAFDVAILVSGAGVQKWDSTSLKISEDVVSNIMTTRSSRGIVVKMAEPGDLIAAKIPGGGPNPSTAPAPAA